jgi:predicted ATP-dependent endonuclease of OLD family
MKINKIFIEKYKNLENTEIIFSDNTPISVIFGKNGSGKTNIIEAILLIFQNFYLGKLSKDIFNFNIIYEIHNDIIEITCKKNKVSLIINNIEININELFYDAKNVFIKKQYLPDNIIIYYSGNSTRIKKILKVSEKKYSVQSKEQIYELPLRPLFYLLPQHAQIILLSLFISDLKAHEDFLKNEMEIESFFGLMLIIKIPVRFQETDIKKINAEFGRIGWFIGLLRDNASNTLSLPKMQHLIYFDSINKLKKITWELGFEKDFFKMCNELYTNRIIREIDVSFKKKSINNVISFENLSEGEQQLIAIRGSIELLRDKETLFLFDEPDTYLHPDWQRNLIEKLSKLNYRDHYILTTHSPYVLGMISNKSVIKIVNGHAFPINSSTYGRDVSATTEEIFEIAPRKDDINYEVNKYFNLLSQNKIQEAEIIFKWLTKTLDEDDPFFIKAKAVLYRKNLLSEK